MFGGAGIPFGAPSTNFSGKAKFNKFTPRASVSFKPTPDHNIYLSYARGFKGGGFDPRGLSTAAPDLNGNGTREANEIFDYFLFDPETVDSFEIGYKASLLDRRLQLAIAGFYGAAFGIGHSTHLSIAEYWRWWVVHLWVEGFFEVFATTVIAFLFARLGLIKASSGTTAVISATTIFLAGGIIGTAHHLYFTGAPAPVMALGAVFSALEVVPLALVGFEAFRNLRILKVKEWVSGYKWAIYFFVSVSFWNMLGAGVFGFLINPPISLFYVQGLNLTPLHAHTALFGVYGMLGIGLMLFCVRSLMPGHEWNDRWIKWGFWGLNGGLLTMALVSLLPLGLAQAWASIDSGLWYARSEEFLYTPTLTFVRWLRVPGDIIFALGALAIGVFMVGLLTGRSLRGRSDEVEAGDLRTTDTEPALHE